MTFFEHLSELRKRIINSLYAIGIGAFIGVYLAKYFVAWINKPMLKALADAHLDPKLIYTHPAGYLNLVITVGVYLGFVLASLIVLYQVWLFVAPALYKHERGAITGFMFSTVFLFLAGIAFGYFVTLPYVLHFLVSPGSLFMIHDLQPMISINEYFDVILLVLLGMGLMFELPVLIFFLSLFGIVTPKFLWKNFRYAILVITVIAENSSRETDRKSTRLNSSHVAISYAVFCLKKKIISKSNVFHSLQNPAHELLRLRVLSSAVCPG